MALEITGLVVGTAALVGTFKDCVDVFGMIVAARSVTDDADILNTKLDIERMLLLQWADRTGLTEPEHYDRRLDDPELSQTVAGALESIKRLLSDGKVLKDRYGLADYQEAQHGIVLGDKLEIKASSTRLQQFLQRFDKLSLRTNMPQREYSIGTRFRWVVKDKEKFASLMEHLSYFVSRLNTLVPAEGQSVGTMTKEDLAQIRSVPQLKLIIRASTRLQPQIAIIAEQAIRSLNQQRVLDRLWFRWIDDRKTTIKDRHFRTLDWALEPPEHVLEWDNLAEWLRDESGLYWLAGKAGSGKSTLMKYLSDHPQANTLLKKWAAQSELVTLQFFFYALGRSEQKSQDGVLRSLLFQFLDKHREVIEEVLPAMWKQAVITEDEIKELEMPSIAEMQASLLQLAGIVSADKRFWILIDGLDEFEGKHSTIAAFISKLAQLPNVKLVVSSRPLPVFVNAFEQAPKMHLQDLTSADIEAYIDDMILNHHHIAQLSRIEPGMAVKIAETLIDKASGVFLWVVLACESILEGLEDYDTVPELMDRVNELPPELGDFFRQIIARLDPRKRDQNARIIRLVFEGQTSLAPIPTVGLDIVDEQGLRTDFSGPNAKIVRNEELVKRCERLEGRLRSRCSGLVEIQTDCAVRLVGNSESLTADGVALVNSRVVFMHRSLYEFLCTEGIWEWDVLSVDSRCGPFESHVILASLWAQLAGLRPWGDIQYKGVCFDNALVHNIRAAATSCPPSLLTTNFSRLQDLFTGDERYSPMWYCAELWLPHQPKCRRSYEDLSAGLALAAEFAMISLVQLALEDPDELRRRLIPPEEGQLMGCCDFVICPTKLYESNMCQPESKSRSRSTVFPLLYHATCRPFLPLFQRMGQSTFKASQEGVDSTELVRYLLSKGNDPNEEFYYNESLSMNEKFSVYEKRSMNEVGVITTPWIRWLSFIGREGLLYSPNDESDPTDLDLDSDVELVHQRGAITMLFVDAGAVVGAPETDMCHLVDNSLSHVILNAARRSSRRSLEWARSDDLWLKLLSLGSGDDDSADGARDRQEAGWTRNVGKPSLDCQTALGAPVLRSREYTSIGPPAIMNSLRIASRAAFRARPAAIRAPLQRRGYAEAVNDKIKLSLTLPHQSIYKSQDVVQVNLPAESGEMGVLANHVPSIEQLKPGLVEIVEESGSSKQFFLSGGFAVVQPNSSLSINAVEAYPLEDFSADAVRNQLAEAQKVANGSGSEQDIAEAKIELEASYFLVVAPTREGPQNWIWNRHADLLSPGSRDSAGFSEVEWWFDRAHVEYQYRTSDLPQMSTAGTQ